MGVRISAAENVIVGNVFFSSFVSVGDTIWLQPKSNVFAVQRELAQFVGTEGDNLNVYPLFSRPIPLPLIDERIDIRFDNSESPFIKVRNIHVLSLAVSAIFHIGTSERVDAETRVKHIRQLLPPRGEGSAAVPLTDQSTDQSTNKQFI